MQLLHTLCAECAHAVPLKFTPDRVKAYFSLKI